MDGFGMTATPRPPRPPSAAASASRASPPPRSASPQSQHRRGYQACDPCRKRKVKCDLGSVDNPRPPPCVRCRRESKRCEFSATRRKRKVSEDAEDHSSTTESDVLRRDKRMMSADGSAMPPVDPQPLPPQPPPAATDPNNRRPQANNSNDFNNGMFKTEDSNQQRWVGAGAPPSSASGSMSSSQRPSISMPSDQYHHQSSFAATHAIQSGQHMLNRAAADLLSPAISNTHDALHLLSEAAGRSEDLNRKEMEMEYKYPGTAQNSSSPAAFNASTVSTSVAKTATQDKNATRSDPDGQKAPSAAGMGWYDQQRKTNRSAAADPTIESQRSNVAQTTKSGEQADYENARRVWSRLRFIRAGWFTVDEAMSYIAYYYKHLAPLGPIVLPDFSSPSTHVRLLMEEPVLTVTMLTIASRHMELTGNGAYCRSYSVHEKLWSYLRGMIERLFWGQEKFGHGSDPAGFSKPRQFSFDSPSSSGKADFNGHLRSLGTVEALLLLTDWHPRALHFPPGDDENTLLDMDAQLLTQIDATNGKEEEKLQSSSTPEGRLAFYKWLEPVWRSDRMSWMLLSTAQALAFELGVFDQKDDLKTSPNESASPSAEQARKRRVRRLILVYISQSSGRLGIPSMLPLPQWNQNTEADHAASHEDYATDLMQDCWMDISKIMHVTNHDLFLSKEHTSNLIKSGQYRDQIDRFAPSLRDFKRKLDARVNYMTPQMRCILSIEYEYTRLYVNCLALQAVVDRWTTIPNDSMSSNVGTNQAGQPTAPLRVLMEQYELNETYIQEVVDASRRILQIVLDGLVPGGDLKHAPVRTFFRILSGMIFILKTFTLGAKEGDVRVSLDLQDRMVDSLRNCIVDDVHVSITIATLLQLLTASIRERFLRFSTSDRADQSAAEPSRERTPTSPQTRDDQAGGGDYRWPNPQQQNAPQQHSLQQQTGFNSFLDNNPNGSHNHPHCQADPLANIPAQSINAPNLGVSFMPPPPSAYYAYYDPGAGSPKPDASSQLDNGTNPNVTNANQPTTTAAAVPPVNPDTLANPTANGHPNNPNPSATPGSSATMSDWLALPLDQFFNSSTAGVEQGLGGTGPMVGEFDMLEVLLKEQYTGAGVAGGGNGGDGQFL